MKKIWSISLLIGIIVFGSSCDNEVDLTSDFKDIPIVYGLLSRADSVSYIKIQRAFITGKGESALDVAQNPDSLYYEDINVELERLSDGEVYTLERVKGEDEGIERGEGIFATQPNYLYKLLLPAGDEFVGGEDYTLKINRGDNKDEITATATIVSDFEFTVPIQVSDINIRYRNYSISWKKKGGAAFYDVKMMIHYLEENEAGEFISQSLLWNVEDNLAVDEGGSNSVSYDIDGEEFFRYIGAELDDNGGRDRIFSSLDFIVDAGGRDFFDFINIGQANTGITSSQIIPTYTNLSEGFGVFSSRNRVLFEGFTLKSESRDSLANGIYTNDLGFPD